MAKDNESVKILATSHFKDFEAYRSWWMSEDKSYDWMRGYYKTHEKEPGANEYVPFMSDFFASHKFYGKSEAEVKLAKEHEAKYARETYISNHLEKLEAMVHYAEAFEQPLNISYLSDKGAYIFLGNPDKGFYIAEAQQFLDIRMVPDYSELSVQEIRALPGNRTGAASTLPANVSDSISVAQTREQVKALEDKEAELRKQMDDANHYRNSELAELKAELDRMEEKLLERKRELMAELNAKKAELDQKIDHMKRQMYLLESEIYSIRCYMGETVSFAKIRSGKNAPDNEPVVLHQKLRFLDEDLGRMISIYNLHWDDRSTFEDFLAHSPAALDTFAPNERCVTLVRLSRHNRRFSAHEKIQNALDDYEAYHGRAVGIIIRNGENLYMGWTDDEKVHIQDDFVMDMTPRVVSEDAYKQVEESEDDYRRRLKAEQDQATQILDGIISRVFIFNILQGIVDTSSILPLPKGVKISKQSEYVQFSLADLWLTDNRFGSFSSIVERCNSRISTGDCILSVQHLTGGRDWSYCSYANLGPDTWENNRGRGDRNRVRDVEVSDCTIYPINLIEQDKPITNVRYRYKGMFGEMEETVCTKDSYVSDHSREKEIIETFDVVNTHYFVSLEKEWSSAGARSNFEVYPSEFINLTYMNSVWLAYAISTKNVGGWTVGGKQVDYAFAIRYLNTAMDFIRERESEEKALLDAIDPSYTSTEQNWPLALSEWKLRSGVRNLTAYQAKRFIKSLKEP